MSDDKKKRRAGFIRISLSEKYEIEYWKKTN